MVKRPSLGRKEGIYWYVLQTHAAAEVAFNRYVRATRNAPGFLYKKPNESEKSCILWNGSNVFFKSGQNFEDLRVETLDGLIVDEYRQQNPKIISVLLPMLAKRQGWADFLTTPNGFDHSYDLYNAALKSSDWNVVHAPSTEAPWWTPAEIESARALMSEDEFAQEILAEFREMGAGKAYKNHGVWNHVDQNPFCTSGEWSPYLPIVVGLDFNVGLMVWELGQVKGQDFFYGDEIAVKNTDSEECAHILAKRVVGHKQGLVLVGDSSGNARKTSAAGQTDYKIIHRVLKEYGIHFQDKTPEINPFVKDRINCINSRLKAADGSIHFWYNPNKCSYLKRDFERVKWKEGTDGAVLDKADPLATHASDSAGYPVAYYSELLKQHVGKLVVLTR